MNNCELLIHIVRRAIHHHWPQAVGRALAHIAHRAIRHKIAATAIVVCAAAPPIGYHYIPRTVADACCSPSTSEVSVPVDVPEPASLLLLAIGATGLVLARRGRRQVIACARTVASVHGE